MSKDKNNDTYINNKQKIAKVSSEQVQSNETVQNLTAPGDEISGDTTVEEVIEKKAIGEETPLTELSSKESTGDDSSVAESSSEKSPSENAPEVEASEVSPVTAKKNTKRYIYKGLRILFTIGFFVFLGLFLNEVWLQPYLANKASEKAKSLYTMPNPTPLVSEDSTPVVSPTATPDSDDADSNDVPSPTNEPTSTPDPTRDKMGRLLQFRGLLDVNSDVKGWLKINNLNGENDTKIDYVVVQSSNGDPDYYLTRDWMGKKVKAGSLFLDEKSSVERNSQNLVIHGHNMTSTDDMFHYLLKYTEDAVQYIKSGKETGDEKDYFDSHPIIDFNTIYQTGQWKIFSIFITNGTNKKEDFFNYTKSEFSSSSDFLNFIYQLRIRSMFNADDVDINENDQILTLSTCSYEVKDYRTVIVARRVRDGEDSNINLDNVTINPSPLCPESFYYRYGGRAPKLTETFEDALANGEINWYSPIE
ncbi:MAG TPA: class B sortase [Mobilitalea sp.]|nr:class B sortase [Mobilitalea sp.]